MQLDEVLSDLLKVKPAHRKPEKEGKAKRAAKKK